MPPPPKKTQTTTGPAGLLECLGQSTTGVYTLYDMADFPPLAVQVLVPLLFVIAFTVSGHVLWIRRLRHCMTRRPGKYPDHGTNSAGAIGASGVLVDQQGSARADSQPNALGSARQMTSDDTFQEPTSAALTPTASPLLPRDRRFTAITVALPSEVSYEERRAQGKEMRMGQLHANTMVTAFAGRLKARRAAAVLRDSGPGSPAAVGDSGPGSPAAMAAVTLGQEAEAAGSETDTSEYPPGSAKSNDHPWKEKADVGAKPGTVEDVI